MSSVFSCSSKPREAPCSCSKRAWNLSPKVGTSLRRLEPLHGGWNLSPEVRTSLRRLEPLRGGWNLSAEVGTSLPRLEPLRGGWTSPGRLEPLHGGWNLFAYICTHAICVSATGLYWRFADQNLAKRQYKQNNVV
jgi:hypothetical protein